MQRWFFSSSSLKLASMNAIAAALKQGRMARTYWIVILSGSKIGRPARSVSPAAEQSHIKTILVAPSDPFSSSISSEVIDYAAHSNDVLNTPQLVQFGLANGRKPEDGRCHGRIETKADL